MRKKLLVISDSFKGTLSSQQIADLWKDKCHFCNTLPLADGGEGSIDVIASAIKGTWQKDIIVHDPYLKETKADYYLAFDNTAYIEVAKVIGLPLIKEKNPSLTSSFGVGELILDAIKKHCQKIVITLGGSCTNDGGCGLLAALKTKFYCNETETFIPVGKTLKQIKKIDLSETKKLLHDIKVEVYCDVSNPLIGKNGASYVYAKQKGADIKMIEELDLGLTHLADIVSRDFNKDLAYTKSTGAAGGIGFGILAMIENSSLNLGIESLLKIINAEKYIKEADIILTGEGQLDTSSFNGKAIDGVCKLVAVYNKPVILLVGQSKLTLNDCQKYYKNIQNIYSCCDNINDNEDLKKYALERYLKQIEIIKRDYFEN